MKTKSIVPIEHIENFIHIVRGQRVMLDEDLAYLYEVETKVLNQAVKRNTDRFPVDFAFRLTNEEWENLRSQFVTSSLNYGGRRYLPLVFTEHGALMLANILRSKRAVKMSIKVIRAFVHMRYIFESNKELTKLVMELRSFMLKNANRVDQEFRKVWNTIEKLSASSSVPKNEVKIGFKLG